LVVPLVNRLVPLFRHVVFTRDWHPPNHISFSAQPEFRDGSWPPHAVRETPGAAFHPELIIPDDALIVSKATQPDREEYSGFQASGADLAAWLRNRGIRRLFIAGIATDYCVRFTALDAARAGFEVFVIEDAVRGVSADTTAATWLELAEAGVNRVRSTELTRPITAKREGR
jgi:nicotinamidase/pyrazinamidase